MITPRRSNGFGYDPLFYLPAIRKSFEELTAQKKSKYSHRGGGVSPLSGVV